MSNVFLSIDWQAFALTAIAFTIGASSIFLRTRFPRLSGRAEDIHAVQAMHKRLTPRVGGLGIFVALCVSVFFVPATITIAYGEFLLAASLLFVVGLAEDLGFPMSPRRRMLAAIAASLLTIALLGIWLPRFGIPGLDSLAQHWAVGIPLTLLLTAGISNGFNLIDGVNGLASLTAMVVAVALGQVASQAGSVELVHLSIMLTAAIFGFFLLNYPFGPIFLGDAGAYTLGFVLSWFGIVVLVHVPEASPWAILLIFFWPVADTSLAIYRRSRSKADVSAPDRLHVHQMVMRALEICFLGRQHRHVANPLTTLILAPFVIAPPIAGVVLWNDPLKAFLATVAFSGLFFASYSVAPRLIRRFRR